MAGGARRRVAAGGLAGALACSSPHAAAVGAVGAATGIGPAAAVVVPALSALPVPATSEASVHGDPLLLAVRVNGVDRDDTVRALAVGGRVSLSASDWMSLHLRPPTTRALRVDGQDYQPLDALAGLRWRIDEPTQTLVIDAPAAAFAGLTLRLDTSAAVQTVPQGTGAFGNYDVEVERDVGGAGASRRASASGLIELGAFGFGGSLDATALLMDNGSGRRATRLDTTWTQDRPDRLASLRLGDAVSHPGAWGRAVRFGGVQWATDFSLQPGLLTFPLPAVHGEATLPSTVDVYVNNSRRLADDVPAGPFDLTELPVVTGSGEVRLVVHDALGREQVIVQPYYVSPSLLKPGLHAFSFEVGAVRDDYGLRSDSYGPFIASATDRAGVTDTFTRELRAEVQPRQVAVGATGMFLLPSIGLASLGLVASDAPGGAGASVIASMERQGRNWNSSLQVQRSTQDFAQIGEPASQALRTQATFALGGTVAHMPVGLSYVYQTPWSGAAERLLSFNLSRGLGRYGALGFFAMRDLASGATTLSLSYSVAFDARSSAALSATRSNGAQASSDLLQVQRNLPEDNGIGYQLTAQADGNASRASAQVFARTDWAELNAGIAQAGDETDVRAGATGGVAWMDGSAFATRHIDGSFAIVEVGDYPDVAILRDNQPVAHTDEHGRALIVGIRGNEVNRIGVDASDLPFDAAVDALDMDYVPPAHSGVVLRLPIQRSRAASFRVVGPDGMPLPAGTSLHVAGHDAVFPVGFDGRAYVSGIAANTRLRAHGPGADCGFTLAVPAGEADDLPDLGTVGCK